MSASKCPTCEGKGFLLFDDGYDLGYGFPVERRETCPNCKGQPYKPLETGDTVRFSYGRRDWTVTGITPMPSGRRSIRLSRSVNWLGKITRTAWESDLRRIA